MTNEPILAKRRTIRLHGVRVNNLKSISLEIPHGQWVSICGISGSGKSSLAFDTLYAEGQRRYLDSLSMGARRFIQCFDRPDAELMEGLPPALAVHSAAHSVLGGATVASITEIGDLLAIIMTGIGKAICPICQIPVNHFSPQSVAYSLAGLERKQKFMVCFATPSINRKYWSVDLREARQHGFRRAIIDQKMIDLDKVDEANWEEAPPQEIQTWESAWPSFPLAKTQANSDWLRPLVVVDRLTTTGHADDLRTLEALEIAFQFGWGDCYLLFPESTKKDDGTTNQGSTTHGSDPLLSSLGDDTGRLIDGRRFHLRRLSSSLVCPQCGKGLPNPQRQFFKPQWVSQVGGSEAGPDQTKNQQSKFRKTESIAKGPSVRQSAPQSAPRLDSKSDTGSVSNFSWHAASNMFQVASHTIEQLYAFRLDQLADWLCGIELDPREAAIANGPLKQIQSRLDYLIRIGLGYLSLQRPLHSTSRGEQQRLLLTKCLGSRLAEILYVLDEPSRGLHPADLPPLIQAISQLNQGQTNERLSSSGNFNTIVVVDHHQELLQAAQRVIEIGPLAGAEGGLVVFDGSPDQLSKANTITGNYWQDSQQVRSDAGLRPSLRQQRTPVGWVRLRGARANNLRNIDVDFPLGCLAVIAGVSGAGKTSLLKQELFPRLKNCFHPLLSPAKDQQALVEPFKNNEHVENGSLVIEGRLDDVVYVDQTSIGNSGRSNPVTFIKAFDEIRKIFAETQEAQQRSLKPADFSFNLKSGRCSRCEGNGQLKVEMQFMADLFLTCDQCQGARFCNKVLSVRHRSLNIAEVLNLTVRESFSFFRGKPKLQTKLKTLIDVGLDYIRLGQPANRLSGGEAQRLKLAQYLAVPRAKPTLFLMEEPTSGLHRHDIDRFLECLENILTVGHSLIIVEHNLHFMRHADWIIELGPGADQQGGRLIGSCKPEELVANPTSVTGHYL